MINKLVDAYYKHNVGYEPESKEDINNTAKVFEYLLEAGVDKSEVMTWIIGSAPSKSSLSFSDIPDTMWQGSLINKGSFYYHGILRLTPREIRFSPSKNIYNGPKLKIEMKIKFDIIDIIDYFYEKNPELDIFRDDKKDSGAIEWLLKKYNSVTKIEPLDLILCLIDMASSDDNYSIKNILSIQDYESEAMNKVLKISEEARENGYNKIIWRH